MNMKNFSRILIIVFIVGICFGAGFAFGKLIAPNGAKVKGVVADAPDSEVIVKLLDVNRYEVLDTVATDAAGKFSYKVEIKKGQPEFVYLFYKDTKVASLLLERGDKVSVKADTLGNFEVSGSEESVKLAQVEKDHAAALGRLAAAAAGLETASGDEAAAFRREMGKIYIDHYRNCVKYVVSNSKSLTSVPVLYQNFGPGLPVFAQTTDAIHFVNTADSLETVYPDSKYVKALRKEAEKRFGYLELEAQLKNATEIGFPEVELPDLNANKIKLSEVDSKVVMLYFWDPSNASQKMFNLDYLKDLYEDYNKKGFEIYQAALTPDKAAWAQTVKSQNLPWINVCDGLGGSSPYIATYNLYVLPSIFIIADGQLIDGGATDEKSLRRLLNKLLK